MIDHTPFIQYALDEPEHEYLRLLNSHLGMLQSHEDLFRAAIMLDKHSEQVYASMTPALDTIRHRGLVGMWSTIAGQHAALTVYNLRSTIHGIIHDVGNCHSRKARIDTKAIQDALDDLEKEFPWWGQMRHTTAHYADMVFSPEQVKKHTPSDGPFVHGTMVDDTIMMSKDGQAMSLSLSEKNLETIRRIKQAVYAAFRKVDALAR
jgi:hypothetical protein